MLVLGIFTLMTAVALPNVHISPILFTRITSIVLLYVRALSYNTLDIQAIGSGVSIYSGLFRVTSVSQWIDIFIAIIGAVILMPWISVKVPEYSLIVLFTTCGRLFLISSNDLISIYLSIELQSFRVYILARLYRDSESATSAGLKYFLLGGLSSRLILLGSAIIYTWTGLTNIESIYTLLSVRHRENRLRDLRPCAIGLTIMVIGFLFKVSRRPFHNWAPDVYDGVPTIVTTWLTTMPKLGIFILILSLQIGVGSSLILRFNDITFDVWKNLLLASSLLSLIIGTVVGLAQYRIKRLLRYSTISHVGFLLLRLSVNTERSVESFLFYLVQYSVTNLNRFLILLRFGYMKKNRRDIRYISDIKGQFYVNPLLGLALSLCLFSIRGVPPLIGFFGKQIILYSATHSGYYFMSFVAILVSIISASYYLKIVRIIHFSSEGNNEKNGLGLTNTHSFRIRTLTLFITLFVFKPSIILNSISLLALTLFRY